METQHYLQAMIEHGQMSIGLKTYINGVLAEYFFKKNDRIFLETFVHSGAFRINEGMVRLYASKDQSGEENTVYIWQQGSFIPQGRMAEGSGRSLYFHFLEDTILQGISAQHLPIIYRVFPEYILVNQSIQSDTIGELLLHLVCLSGTKAEERFAYLQSKHKALQRTVAQKYIASFLGMDIKTYSRLRAKKH